MEDICNGIFKGLENWCIVFNDFCLIFFQYMKYIFAFILIILGILTLLSLRRIYFNAKILGDKMDLEFIRKSKLSLGTTYIILGTGILFNYLTYFLIICLDPLPDRFIFNFLNFNGDINPYYMNRIINISTSEYHFEKTIYYCFSLVSFYAIVHLFISIWYLLNNRSIDKPRKTIIWLFDSILLGILFGFSTCLPFLL